ncbi:MAG: tRNA lysidine(34) synthetase TilS, partial [Desulfuromonadales bacterium]|nr:tRNA lysidine(34) synthetase TilS [Desulfuromonadales bacterium]
LNFTRNRIRHQLLPCFATLNPRIEETLSALAGLAAQEDDYWQGETKRLAAHLVQNDGASVRLSVTDLLLLHPAQRYRLLHHLLTPFAQRAAKEVSRRHVATLDGLLLSRAPQGEVHLPGVKAIRRYDQLSLSLPSFPLVAPWRLEISGPGLSLLPSGGALRIEFGAAWEGASGDGVDFAADALVFPWMVRTVQAGDRLRLAGMSGRKRLKELLIEEKFPLEERRRLCVLEKEEEILWAVGLRRSGLSLPAIGESFWRVVYMPPNSGKIP